MIEMIYEYPAYGQLRALNELRKRGILVSSGGIRSIWLRHGLETFRKRLKALVEKAAKEGIVYTEEQPRVLEQARREHETVPDEIETHHPGYLLAQDANVGNQHLDRWIDSGLDAIPTVYRGPHNLWTCRG